MGGFRFNGCGATDHFKKIKSLGTHQCPRCQKAAEFFLEEAKFKVDVFFIPTVTLKSRYAVMCGKCEQGEFCSDQWAVNLLNSTGPIPVIFESQARPSQPTSQITAAEKNPSPAAEQITYTPSEPSARQSASAGTAVPSFFKCPHCGVTQLREGAFCSFCGKPAPEGPDPQGPDRNGPAPNEPDETVVCSSCGNRQKSGMKFCSNCGQPMEAQSPPEWVCPGCGAKTAKGIAFCMECGTKL